MAVKRIWLQVLHVILYTLKEIGLIVMKYLFLINVYGNVDLIFTVNSEFD